MFRILRPSFSGKVRFPARTPGNLWTQGTVRHASYKRFQPAPKFSVASLLSNRLTLYFGGGCVAFYFYNLDEAPFTHRRRFIWIPYWMETKIGDYSYSQIMAQYKGKVAPKTDPVYAQITRVMNKLLASAIDNTQDPNQAAHLKLLNWTINVVNVTDPRQEPPNAFILPNGKIFIFSSILPICQNEDGLATVLSHELSHQLAHHSLEQLSKQPFYIMLSTLLYATTGISWFNDLLIAGLLKMPSSREMESEADHIGCELMARLCFDVKEAVNFWWRMEAWESKQQMQGSGLLQQFLSSHPNTQKRIKDIHTWMPELELIKESLECNQWGRFSDFSRDFFGRAKDTHY